MRNKNIMFSELKNYENINFIIIILFISYRVKSNKLNIKFTLNGITYYSSWQFDNCSVRLKDQLEKLSKASVFKQKPVTVNGKTYNTLLEFIDSYDYPRCGCICGSPFISAREIITFIIDCLEDRYTGIFRIRKETWDTIIYYENGLCDCACECHERNLMRFKFWLLVMFVM